MIILQGYFHLGNERYISVKVFEGQTRIDIRQYNKFGEKIYPTKLGIHLTETQFANLLLFIDDIDKDVKKFQDKKVESFRYNIGDGICVSVTDGYPVVHVRLYFQNELMPCALPTKTGLALRFSEWDNLVTLAVEVQKKLESSVSL